MEPEEAGFSQTKPPPPKQDHSSQCKSMLQGLRVLQSDLLGQQHLQRLVSPFYSRSGKSLERALCSVWGTAVSWKNLSFSWVAGPRRPSLWTCTMDRVWGLLVLALYSRFSGTVPYPRLMSVNTVHVGLTITLSITESYPLRDS